MPNRTKGKPSSDWGFELQHHGQRHTDCSWFSLDFLFVCCFCIINTSETFAWVNRTQLMEKHEWQFSSSAQSGPLMTLLWNVALKKSWSQEQREDIRRCSPHMVDYVLHTCTSFFDSSCLSSGLNTSLWPKTGTTSRWKLNLCQLTTCLMFSVY